MQGNKRGILVEFSSTKVHVLIETWLGVIKTKVKEKQEFEKQNDSKPQKQFDFFWSSRR